MMQQLAADAEQEELSTARGGPAKQRSYSNATSNSGGASSDYSSERSGSFDEEDELI
jgi:hypothetical protein